MKKPQMLIVDDEPDLCKLLTFSFQALHWEIKSANSLTQAKKLLRSQHFDFCLTDMCLPDGDGLVLIDEAKRLNYFLPVGVLTAHGNIEIAVNAMKRGAFDFISKPFDIHQLKQISQSVLQLHQHIDNHLDIELSQLLGQSRAICEIRQKILKLASSKAPVHISGESGTGKELVARLIHQQGMGLNKPFVAVNCGAIPLEIMESEFFGHRKGSFTGAINDKKGLFEIADGGSLFLDEIADLPLLLQVKLLRALQERKIRPVGGTEEIAINVRILSASHKKLSTLVSSGHFREDLYYRINVIELFVPPLRERISDIELLVTHILAKLSPQPAVKLHHLALQKLIRYHFPGNIRELENILQRALTFHQHDCIMECDIELPQTKQSALEDHLEEIERHALLTALDDNQGNKTAAAKQLGLSFRSFRYRLKKLHSTF